MRRLVEIGAVQQHHAGFTLVNPHKALTSLCAARSVMSDAIAVVTLSPSDRDSIEAALGPDIIIGGASAAVELLGGVNTVSDFSEHLLYLRDDDTVEICTNMLGEMNPERHTGYGHDRGNVTFLSLDARAARVWRSHASFAQTYADLFVTPGWQASEFRLALHERFFGTRDWDQQ
ncbi:MAG: hypothetical protein WBA87_18190 [Microbacterium sp.]